MLEAGGRDWLLAKGSLDKIAGTDKIAGMGTDGGAKMAGNTGDVKQKTAGGQNMAGGPKKMAGTGMDLGQLVVDLGRARTVVSLGLWCVSVCVYTCMYISISSYIYISIYI